MTLEPLCLFTSYKERLVFFIMISVILALNLSWKYMQYIDLKKEEFVRIKATAINIYDKSEYRVVQFKTDNYRFFTQVNDEIDIKKQEVYSMVLLSHGIEFIDFIKGFYTQTLLYELSTKQSFKSKIKNHIEKQHEDKKIQELFSALFLAIPLSSAFKEYFSILSISHLIAISGFHLSVMSFCLYGLLSILYKPIHQRFLLYRNRRFDVMMLCVVILFLYLLLSGIVPSLLRAFIMFVVALTLLRCHIQLLSYETLLYCFVFIVALFPSYIFSIGLWFSFIAVFYIYLFIQYFHKGNKWLLMLLFNVWMFFVFNPIVHNFFEQTSHIQLLSPFLTVLFTFFYPFELLLHVLEIGHILDEYLKVLLNYEIVYYSKWTPWWFMIMYVMISLVSIVKKEAFYVLNILMIGFNGYLYL